MQKERLMLLPILLALIFVGASQMSTIKNALNFNSIKRHAYAQEMFTENGAKVLILIAEEEDSIPLNRLLFHLFFIRGGILSSLNKLNGTYSDSGLYTVFSW